MPRGRFISKEITLDKKVNNLADDTSRLAFTWLITFADCEGRTPGDPAVVRSLLFARRVGVRCGLRQTLGPLKNTLDNALTKARAPLPSPPPPVTPLTARGVRSSGASALRAPASRRRCRRVSRRCRSPLFALAHRGAGHHDGHARRAGAA